MTDRVLKKLGSYSRKIRIQKLYNKIVNKDWNGKEEYEKEINFLKEKKKIVVFPYEFQDRYQPEMDWVEKDEKGIFTYTKDDETCRKLYFYGEKAFVANKYRNLRREQDPESPHRYFTAEFYPSENDIFIDVGAAEGKEALSIVDLCRKIFIFEADNNWIKALEKTFNNKDSVKIYNCFAGAEDNEEKNIVKLDTVFADLQDEEIFLKLDVEGMEKEVLKGAFELIKRNNVRICITTYHRQDDAEKLKTILEDLGLYCMYSDNYMIYLDDDNLKPPYFRHGLIRAFKK